jgi:hypothetical protein
LGIFVRDLLRFGRGLGLDAQADGCARHAVVGGDRFWRQRRWRGGGVGGLLVAPGEPAQRGLIGFAQFLECGAILLPVDELELACIGAADGAGVGFGIQAQACQERHGVAHGVQCG